MRLPTHRRPTVNNSRRLPEGGQIDRNRPIAFRFNDKPYQGYAGDTLASALLANGVMLTARSFKYHRPRGIMSAGIEEPSSLVELTGDGQSANRPITDVKLRPGLVAHSVHCWPSPAFDVMGINQFFARLIPAAFYYKTFMWPNWHLFEPAIRRAAGLAQAPRALPTSLHYEVRNHHCDLLVIGAGPSGLIAALAGARSGARVLLTDEGSTPGGSLLDHHRTVDGVPGWQWAQDIVSELDRYPHVTRLAQATAWAYREHNLVLITERAPAPAFVFQRTWRVRAKQVVIASGAIERPLVFRHNDRPGVMLASAVQRYINRYAVLPGKQVVLFTNNTSAYRVADALHRAGASVVALIDSRARTEPPPRPPVHPFRVLTNHIVVRTHGTKRIRGVTIRDMGNGTTQRLPCDLVCLSGGWNPTLHLFSQSRGTIGFDDTLATIIPAQPAQDTHCVGAANGHFTLHEGLEECLAKTGQVIEALGLPASSIDLPTVDHETDYHIEPLWHIPTDKKGAANSFVDIQNDVTLGDIHLAIREGFGAVEHVKRYTTAGMGIDQGKTGNLNVAGAIANATDTPVSQIGVTTFRPPYTPVEFGAIAGGREDSGLLPYRHTPMTEWHKAGGAVMYEAGARWRRPGYYPGPGETFQQAVNREATAVRTGVGVYDGSPLGKYEIRGPDAGQFIDMLYTNDFSSLGQGKGRYGIMLTDDGMILDDGVTFKLAENHYLMFTSTGHANEIYRHMEYFLQLHRPEWKVRITTVTTQWSNATVCGPKAREMLTALQPDIDCSPTAFPFMAIKEGDIAGLPARICRVSFTGELSFEINVWPRHAMALWDRIMDVGEKFRITPVGSEANHVLRVEKGFLSTAHEVDGTTDPYDLGLGRMLSRQKRDFIGKQALAIRRTSGRPRLELVGLLPQDPTRLVSENAPLTPRGQRMRSEGRVTACVWSVVKNRPVALALLEDGHNRMGQRVHIRMKDDVVAAEVTAACFHDADGHLLRS